MILCGEKCSPACDFCVNYLSIGDLELWGYCTENKRVFSFGDYCEDFYCYRALKLDADAQQLFETLKLIAFGEEA